MLVQLCRILKKVGYFFKNDKNGIVHFSFRYVFHLTLKKLAENLVRFYESTCFLLNRLHAKGKFIRKVTVSSTMGVGIPLNPDEVAL